MDARGAGTGGYGSTYYLEWYGSGIPHLEWIANGVGTPENYTFSTTSQSLLDPFTSSSFGSATVLQSVTVNGLNIAHQFQYDSSAEMKQVTTPLGGVLGWTYFTNAYTTRSYREVGTRTMTASPGTSDSWSITQDGNPNWHGSATVADAGTSTKKVWTFSTTSDFTAGLATEYQEIDSTGTALLEKDYRWYQSPSSNAYMGRVTTTLNPGAGYSAQMKAIPVVDGYGNVSSYQVDDYQGSTTGQRTYNMTYGSQSGTQYYNYFVPYYLFNRLVTATVMPGFSGTPVTFSSTMYDGPYMISTNATNNHDPAYTATGGPPRGNPWVVSGLNGADTVSTNYDSAGVPYYSSNAAGQSVNLSTDSTTNFSLPTTILPNNNSSMPTTATYASSWAPAALTGPNGDRGTTSYDSYGRPSQTTTPDGAVTTYTYTYSPDASTQTATLDGRWQTTTLDGFGRTIQVQNGNGSTVVSTVQTQYAPCACSPLGKVWRVSEPYAPGATPVWTTYTYDASGRVLTVQAADGASTTTYSYQGNSTTVTDPAGKWKTSTVDAYGNVFLVTEPNPAGGTFTTNYTYTLANQLTGVSMTRGSVTQTRTFLYTGSDLTSATNPENGTVTYTYDSGHHVTSRTDAIGNQTQYSYDAYGRLTEVQYYPNGGVENTFQRVNYYYDNNVPPAYSGSKPANGIGRQTGVGFGGGVKDSVYDAHYYTYVYSYNTAGRVTTQTSRAMAATWNYYNGLQPVSPAFATMTIGYQWDDEGRITSMAPSMALPTSQRNSASFPTMGYQYDANGRLNTLTSSGSTFATATYTPAGQLYQLSYGGLTETRTYNSMMQLIAQSVPGYLNLTYNYSPTQNNGRITSSVDGVTGESSSYSYDALNRLSAASNSLWSGSYAYDGFGNLTSKSGSGGSPNSFPSMTASYNSNNQLTTVSYDGNGNTSLASGYSYGYTVENKLNSRVSQYWPYGETLYGNDPSGRRVMKLTNPDPNNYEGEDNPLWEFYFYTINGQRLVTIDCNNANAQYQPNCWPVGENTYFGRRMVFVYQPDVPLKSVVRRFCWTKGGAWRTVGLDETRWSVRRRQAT